MIKSNMWNPDEVQGELDDAKKARRQSKKDKDIGLSVYWSGYIKALEVVLNKPICKKCGSKRVVKRKGTIRKQRRGKQRYIRTEFWVCLKCDYYWR